MLLNWETIKTLRPFKVVLLYRKPDLFPVVGFWDGEDHFLLEEAGPEDGEHRTYPFLSYKPTHWAYIPSLPA